MQIIIILQLHWIIEITWPCMTIQSNCFIRNDLFTMAFLPKFWLLNKVFRRERERERERERKRKIMAPTLLMTDAIFHQEICQDAIFHLRPNIWIVTHFVPSLPCIWLTKHLNVAYPKVQMRDLPSVETLPQKSHKINRRNLRLVVCTVQLGPPRGT